MPDYKDRSFFVFQTCNTTTAVTTKKLIVRVGARTWCASVCTAVFACVFPQRACFVAGQEHYLCVVCRCIHNPCKSGGPGRAVQAVRWNAACKRVTRLIASGRWCTKACVCVNVCLCVSAHNNTTHTLSLSLFLLHLLSLPLGLSVPQSQSVPPRPEWRTSPNSQQCAPLK